MARLEHLANWRPASKVLRIRRECAEAFGVTDADIIGRRRFRRVTRARQAAAFVLRKRCGLSTTQVAVVIGLNDHSTVVHACRQTLWRMERDGEFAARVAALLQGREARQHDAYVLAWLASKLPVIVSPAGPIFEDEELAEFVDPARRHCAQCDRAVTDPERRGCRQRLCTGKAAPAVLERAG